MAKTAKPPGQVNQTFGEHLAELRNEAELSVHDAAFAAGFTDDQWSSMEADRVYPKVRMLRPMAFVLGVEPCEVL